MAQTLITPLPFHLEGFQQTHLFPDAASFSLACLGWSFRKMCAGLAICVQSSILGMSWSVERQLGGFLNLFLQHVLRRFLPVDVMEISFAPFVLGIATVIAAPLAFARD
jgi:predicted lysophospholipase L1 biosynthesis ABC-type transport system permease subunit